MQLICGFFACKTIGYELNGIMLYFTFLSEEAEHGLICGMGNYNNVYQFG